MKNIIKQLTEVYLSPAEYWHTRKLSSDESDRYHQIMIERGNIIWSEDKEGFLLGYCEFFRINFEQLGRLICHAPFYNLDENTTDGNICLVHNGWIRPEYRFSFVIEDIKKEFFEKNKHCDYFVESALRKKTQPIKVFKKEDLHNRILKDGFINLGA